MRLRYVWKHFVHYIRIIYLHHAAKYLCFFAFLCSWRQGSPVHNTAFFLSNPVKSTSNSLHNAIVHKIRRTHKLRECFVLTQRFSVHLLLFSFECWFWAFCLLSILKNVFFSLQTTISRIVRTYFFWKCSGKHETRSTGELLHNLF